MAAGAGEPLSVGVFGSRARSRLRRRVEKDLFTTTTWRVFVHGRSWLCPFCAKVAVETLPEAERWAVEAVVDHLDEACPEFRGGEGPERPLLELRRLAGLRELRRRVKRELPANPAWQLMDASRRWYCPYCAEPTGVTVPGDRTLSEDVLQAICGHLEACYAFDHGQGRERPLADLKSIVRHGDASRRLGDSVRRKLEGDPAWRRKDARGRWVCPYCLQVQEHVDLSTSLQMFENAPAQIAQHLAAACAEFKAGAQPKPLDASSSRGSGIRTEAAGSIPDTDPTGTATAARRGSQEQTSSLGSREVDGVWGRDAGVAERAVHGTTLRDVESSGEFLLIDDPEVRQIAAASGTREALPQAAAPQPSSPPSAAPPPGAGATGSRSDERRAASEWRREIERELQSVKSLSPGTSTEIEPPAVGADATAQASDVAARLDLAARGVALSVVMLPAVPPRGDFVDVFELDRDRLGLIAGGVVGEDDQGALVSALARHHVRTFAATAATPDVVLRRVNQELWTDAEPRVFVAVVYAVLDLTTRTLQVSRAGLTAPVLMNPQRSPPLQAIRVEGMVMGIDKGPIFDTALEARTLQLAAGDLVVLFTNGILEARGGDRSELGVERMHGLVRRYGTHEAEYFTDKFREHYELHLANPSKPATDACLIALKCT